MENIGLENIDEVIDKLKEVLQHIKKDDGIKIYVLLKSINEKLNEIRSILIRKNICNSV